MLIRLDLRFIPSIGSDVMKKKYFPKLKEIHEQMQYGSAKGIEMTGWMPWVFRDHSEIFQKSEKIREDWIRNKVQTVVIIGTGGSYLGSKACLEFVEGRFPKSPMEFIFLPYVADRCVESTIEHLKNQKFAIVVISKSGGTLESAVTFRILRNLLFEKEGEEHSQYVISITTKGEGLLYKLSVEHQYHIFEIEKNIGGRYSTLTPVGLVPAILRGISGEELIRGARDCHEDYYHLDYDKNLPFQYAAYRHFFFNDLNLNVECLISYDPHLNGILHKMKQLFSESEGKSDKGLIPVILDFTPDLHSIGQLLQEGKRVFFETILWVNDDPRVKIMDSKFGNDDGIDWLRNASLSEINYAAFMGTVKAHNELRGVNVIILYLPNWTAYTFGYLYFFLCLTAMFSAYLLEQNPFDQPGVEAYKSRMISMLKSRGDSK
ncbi:hypothetical protein [Candidatus Mycoplasma haematominutum]|uniref:Glucose-6-phosphate isomerase n=1 Tax=Candidatus Mycoplasma haematominutum 'Birmingham 1' TaxID=1116213 RepID=G8C2I0_9MOLU|nr:hypothetical protein [Candidatus Mycoplasma haematominutum]CCE66528.1 glucose-6-phosphate isomerase [Candidatus Mycoplasma haematominutum 'Birmingham 1']